VFDGFSTVGIVRGRLTHRSTHTPPTITNTAAGPVAHATGTKNVHPMSADGTRSNVRAIAFHARTASHAALAAIHSQSGTRLSIPAHADTASRR